QDNNDNDLISVSLTYSADQLTIGAALEQWSLDPANQAEEVDNLRLTATYTMDQLQFGAIFESTDSDDTTYDRDAYGVNAKYRFDETLDMRVQYLVADDHSGQADSGAQHLALGVFNQLDEATQIYAAYTLTDNDANANYQGIDGGHGDELTTTAGGSPSSISVGAVYKF
ncbi:MAG: porin, partial [Thiohalophilus sp.]|uniref:porin n=1 Tax=Thiohalophilus sp. TaxID=3028392 RepID=UPI00286FE1CA